MAIARRPAFETDEYQRRIERVRASMAQRSLDGLVLVGPHNINYLSGMDSENLFDFQALIVPLEGEPDLVIFDFELGRAEASSWLAKPSAYTSFEDPVTATLQAVSRAGLSRVRIGLEQRATTVSAGTLTRLADGLSEARLEDAFGIVEGVRLVKSEAEIAYIRRAAALTDAAVLAGYAAMRVGVADHEVAAAIMGSLYGSGSETVCWGPIVASGYLAGAAHSSFNGRRLEAGDTVFLELTGEVRRYVAPLMRTAILGEPTPEQAAVAAAGAEAVQTLLRESRAGRPASEVAKIVGEVVAPILDRVVFHHYFGYPVGIGMPPSWIEALGFFIRVDEDRPLEEGMVFHLPMSFRRYGEWGINQSHTMLVRADGAEALTRTEAALQVLA
ncbi:Xaa-Pro peptidase family protein [soil metagenome]